MNTFKIIVTFVIGEALLLAFQAAAHIANGVEHSFWRESGELASLCGVVLAVIMVPFMLANVAHAWIAPEVEPYQRAIDL